jgi:hypothetical protein
MVDVVSAQVNETFISTAYLNNMWILNKATRKLIFIQFKADDKIWKSEPITIPKNFNVQSCILTYAGARGDHVFLLDQSSGMTTIFEAKSNHKVEKWLDFDAGKELQ